MQIKIVLQQFLYISIHVVKNIYFLIYNIIFYLFLLKELLLKIEEKLYKEIILIVLAIINE